RLVGTSIMRTLPDLPVAWQRPHATHPLLRDPARDPARITPVQPQGISHSGLASYCRSVPGGREHSSCHAGRLHRQAHIAGSGKPVLTGTVRYCPDVVTLAIAHIPRALQ